MTSQNNTPTRSNGVNRVYSCSTDKKKTTRRHSVAKIATEVCRYWSTVYSAKYSHGFAVLYHDILASYVHAILIWS